MRLEAYFDGHCLSDAFAVLDVSRPLSGSPTVSTRDVPGRDGTVVLGTRRAAPKVSVTLAALGRSPEDVGRSMRALAGWLAVDSPRRLEFSDEPGLHRMAVPCSVGAVDVLGLVNGRAEVSFLVPDACLHGARRSFASSGGTCRVEVGGTLPAPVLVEAPSASGDFAVVDEGGTGPRVSVGASPKAVVIDSENGRATVGGAAAMAALDTDWLVLAPGRHVLVRSGGTGEFTATVEERWA